MRVFWKIISSQGQARISHDEGVLLDLLRALAAILVVVFHARTYTLGGSEMTGLESLAYSLTNCGTPAVFWFFVLSGYLVGGSSIIEVSQKGRLDFRRYFVSRATRLYVVLIPALLLTGALDYLRISAHGMHHNAGLEDFSSYQATTLLGNIFFLQTTVVPTFGSNIALWSLANEFWYYLMFPLLFAPFMAALPMIWRIGLFMGGLGVLAFLLSANFSIVWLFSLWCMGAAARVLPLRLVRSRPAAMALAVAGLLSFQVLHPLVGPLATLVVGLTFTIMLVALCVNPYALHPALAGAAQRVARFSFSLYIIHLPVQHFLLTAFSGQADPFLGLDPWNLAAPATIGLLTIASLGLAWLFAHFTEERTEALRRRVLARLDGGPAPAAH